MNHRALAPAMFGRQAQIHELQEYLKQVQRGVGQVVLIAGEAGIGKTRLIREFVRGLHAIRGAEVIEGHCYDEQPAVPFGPFVELMRLLAQAYDTNTLAQFVGPGAGELARLLPEFAPLVRPYAGEGDPQLEKRRLFDTIYRALRPREPQHCRVVIIEDLHWSDQTSQELIHYLSRAIERDRVLIIGSYRTDELHRRHPLTHLIAQLTRDRLYHEIRLTPLAKAEFTDMLEATLERSLPDNFVHALYERTEGNPFFVEEVIESLIEHAQLDPMIDNAQYERRIDRVAIPISVKDSLLRRTADLGADTAAVLSYAAVIGRHFDFDLLLRLTGLEEETIVRALALLIERQLIIEEAGPEDRYRFRHELIRETVYEDLLRRERRMKHREVMEVLETQEALHPETCDCTIVEQLAYHSQQARVLPQAAHYARRAGDRAFGLHAYSEAAAHYEAALESDEGQDSLARAELLARIGHSVYPLGDFQRSTRYWHEALALYEQRGEHRRVGDLYRWLGYAAWELNNPKAAFDYTRTALERLEPEPPGRELAMASSALSRLYMLTNQHNESIEWGERALALAAVLGDDGVRSHALNNIGVSLAERGEHETGIAKLVQSLELARAAVLPNDVVRAYSNLGGMLVYTGQFRRAADLLLEGVTYTRQLGWELQCTTLLEKLIWSEIMVGRYNEARNHIEQLVRSGGRLTPGHRQYALNLQAQLLARQGRSIEARQLIEQIQYDTLETNDCGKIEWERIQCFLLIGDTQQALAAAERGLSLSTAKEELQASIKMLSPFIEAYHSAGRHERAQALLAELEQIAPSTTAPEQATLAYLYGLRALQGEQPAAELFGRAAALWQMMEAPFEEARARRQRAEALFQSGDPLMREEARTELGIARERAEALGALRELEAIDSLLRRYFPARRVTAATGRSDGLTPRERQVLGLIARGYSNREIAEELVISEKTAETHVSNILSKLNLASRTQAAAYALEHGLAEAA